MITANQFRENLKFYINKVTQEHEPIKVSRENGANFVVMSLEDYEREQETLYVLSNTSLMNQIQESIKTFKQSSGYTPTEEELNLNGN